MRCSVHLDKSIIEKGISEAISTRHSAHHDTIFTSVRGHIGIQGNEEADQQALLQSLSHHLTEISKETVTELGVRAISRARRAKKRHVPSFGKHRSLWHRKAMTAQGPHQKLAPHPRQDPRPLMPMRPLSPGRRSPNLHMPPPPLHRSTRLTLLLDPARRRGIHTRQ